MMRKIILSDIFKIVTAFLCVIVPETIIISLSAYQFNSMDTLYNITGNRREIISSFTKHDYYCTPTASSEIFNEINKYTNGEIHGTYYISLESLMKSNDDLDLCIPIHSKQPLYSTYRIQFVIISSKDQVKHIVPVEIKVSAIGKVS